ncbi:MAG: methyl-accepting chemotaxis protein [bacterium]
MKFLNNFKIKTKFRIVLVGTIANMFVFNFITSIALKECNNRYFEVISINEDILTDSVKMVEAYGNVRLNANNLIYTGNLSNEMTSKIDTCFVEANNVCSGYLTQLNSIHNLGYDRTEEINILNNIITNLATYENQFDQVVDAFRAGNPDLALQIDVDLTVTGGNLTSQITQITQNAANKIIEDTESVQNYNSTIMNLMNLVFLLSILIQLVVNSIISTAITKSLNSLRSNTLEVANGNMQVSIISETNDEVGDVANAVNDMAYNFVEIIGDIHQLSANLQKGNLSNFAINENNYTGDYKQMVVAINSTIKELLDDVFDLIDNLQGLNEGNFDKPVKKLLGEKAVISKSFGDVQSLLKEFSNSVNELTVLVEEGNFDKQVDSSGRSGEWVKISDGLNNLINTVAKSIRDTQVTLTEFSKGNFSYRITGDYKGEFKDIKDAANNTADAVGSYISEISEILDEMAHDNYDVNMHLDYVGDFVKIRDSVNSIVENLNVLTKNISLSSAQVSDGAKQISNSSIILAEGATEQAQSVEKLTSITSLIAEQSDLSVKNSEDANIVASKAKVSADEGNQQMNEMLKAMSEINEASNSISNIIKVIDDIAFQTNILALNAAVEAARAGEHGKGFAVVAEEVRSLAGRSQQAAKETTELIETTMSKVDSGSNIANTTSKSLVEIVTQIEEISKMININERSSKEQQKSVKEITENISQISMVTQNNAATSEESAAAAEELSSQADIFYNSISKIKTKN